MKKSKKISDEHKRFILSNIVTLIEFNLTSIDYLYQVASTNGFVGLANEYKIIYTDFQNTAFLIQKLLKKAVI